MEQVRKVQGLSQTTIFSEATVQRDADSGLLRDYVVDRFVQLVHYEAGLMIEGIDVILKQTKTNALTRDVVATWRPETTKNLMVGGPGAGEMIHVEGDCLSVEVLTPPLLLAVTTREPVTVETKTLTYRRSGWHPDLRCWTMHLV